MGSDVKKVTFTTRDWVVTVNLKTKTVSAALTDRGAKHVAKGTYDSHSLDVMLGRFQRGDTEYINTVAAKIFNGSIGKLTIAEKRRALRVKITAVDDDLTEVEKQRQDCTNKLQHTQKRIRERAQRMLDKANAKHQKLTAQRKKLKDQLEALD